MTPPDATSLNITLISSALSDSTPCIRTLAAILSPVLVYDNAAADAGCGSVAAGFIGRGCIGGCLAGDCGPCREQTRVKRRNFCARRLR